MKDFDADAFAQAAAAAVRLPLPAHCRQGVAANLVRLAAMADALLSFPIPGVDGSETPANDLPGHPLE